MTPTSPPSPQSQAELLDQLRRRSLGDDVMWLDVARTIAGNPLARGIGQFLGVDLGPLGRAISEYDEDLDTIVASMAFAERGWAPFGDMPAPAYQAAVTELAAGGTIEAAEDALVEGWTEQTFLSGLHHRVLSLGFGNDDEIAGWYRERGRLVGCAWAHHASGAYEAAIPILFAQIDGITADATLPPKGNGGKMFFSPSGGHYVDVVDDTTLAGMNAALPVARRHFMVDRHFTAATGSLSRHGVMHGRELRYDTKANSIKTFVLLAAVVEWARPRIRAEIEHRRVERDKRFTNSNETDSQGRRLDRRGFFPTRDSLRRLSFAQSAFWRDRHRFGSMPELRADVSARTLLAEADGITIVQASAQEWWAWRRSDSGWVFAIGCRVDEDPLDRRYYDGAEPPSEGPTGGAWSNSDTGNWSGDWT